MAVIQDILVRRTLLVGDPIQPVIVDLTDQISTAFEVAFPLLLNYTVTVSPSAQLRQQVAGGGEYKVNFNIVVDDGVVPIPVPDTAFTFCGGRITTRGATLVSGSVLTGGSII